MRFIATTLILKRTEYFDYRLKFKSEYFSFVKYELMLIDGAEKRIQQSSQQDDLVLNIEIEHLAAENRKSGSSVFLVWAKTHAKQEQSYYFHLLV